MKLSKVVAAIPRAFVSLANPAANLSWFAQHLYLRRSNRQQLMLAWFAQRLMSRRLNLRRQMFAWFAQLRVIWRQVQR